MIFSFDKNGLFEKPMLVLANPNKKEICSIAHTTGLHIKPRFNAISELSFDINEEYFDLVKNQNRKLPYYDLLVKNRLIQVEGFGWFVINEVKEVSEGYVPKKSVTAFSYEYVLNSKGINLLSGTYKLFDPIDTSKSLLHNLIKNFPSWKVGYIDPDLWNKYRTFDVPSATTYGFLMNDVEKTFECIFEFDTELQSINASTAKNIVRKTDISLSLDNLVKHIQVTETSEDIITAIRVRGSDSLDISAVNPLGTNIIYMFDYYKNINWMSQELIDAIDKFEVKFNANQLNYSNLLSALKTQNAELIVLNSELVDLEGQYKAVDAVRAVQLPNVTAEITSKCSELQVKIAQKKTEIELKKAEIEATNIQTKGIHKDCDFENNFTEDEMLELDSFIKTSEFIDENFVVTSIMKPDEIIDIGLELYEQGKNALKRLSQPKFSFSMDSVNFLFVEKFKPFSEQLRLGCVVNVEFKQDIWFTPILLEIDIDFDSPDSFSMTFGNRFRIDDSEWLFSDLYQQQSSNNTNVTISKALWNGVVNSDFQNLVEMYMNEALDLSKQEIIDSVNNEFTIGQYGIRGRKKKEDGTYEDEQIWISANQIVFTDNDWQSAKAAFGKIKDPYGEGYSYGLVADVIAGKILAGNHLLITNESSSFTVDGDKATLINADFIITTTRNTSRIIMNSTDGIKIQGKNSSNQWEDKLYADTDGNLVLCGVVDMRKNYKTEMLLKDGKINIYDDGRKCGEIGKDKMYVNGVYTGMTDVGISVDYSSAISLGFSATGAMSGYRSWLSILPQSVNGLPRGLLFGYPGGSIFKCIDSGVYAQSGGSELQVTNSNVTLGVNYGSTFLQVERGQVIINGDLIVNGRFASQNSSNGGFLN